MLPSTMRAITIAGPGGPEQLVPVVRPLPVPGGRELLIAVEYAGVNRHDAGQRRRGHPPAGATDIPGLEVSGTVVATGEAVTRVGIGDRVCALVNGGGYAPYCLADERTTLPLPPGFGMREAAALPEALYTLWHNLIELCAIAPGDWLLVHGGTSGVGSIGMAFARWLGARPVATCGSDDKCAVALSMGALAACNYQRDDFVPWIAEVTGGHGADVILDMAGGTYAVRNLQALALDGRITHLTGAIEPAYHVPLELLMRKRARVTGSLLRPLSIERKARITEGLLARLWPQMAGLIVPRIDHEFSLDEAVAAHQRLERGEAIGKILLRP